MSGPAGPAARARPTLATVWLDGCSGCHMSFLDLDERLLDLASWADLVYSPLIDRKEYPEGVDVCLVEGAVSSEDDLARIQLVRSRTKTLVSFGDCAVTTNVPGMRNPVGPAVMLRRAYVDGVGRAPGVPTQVVPELLPIALPVHKVVTVDAFLPGCPPTPDLILATLESLLRGDGRAGVPLGRFG